MRIVHACLYVYVYVLCIYVCNMGVFMFMAGSDIAVQLLRSEKGVDSSFSTLFDVSFLVYCYIN